MTEGWESEEALVNVQEMLREFNAAEEANKKATAGKKGSPG